MAARSSPSSYKLKTLATFLCQYRAVSGGSWRSHHTHNRDRLLCKVGGGGSLDQGLRSISVNSKLGMEMKRSEKIEQPQPPPGPKFEFSNWVKWILGSVVTFLLPFWTSKWDNFLTLEGQAAKVIGEVEAVAEVVETVATAADKALEEVANQLPDNSKLKEAAQVLEHASTVAAQDAQIVENIIHKVSDVKKDLEDLETMVDPIINKIVKKGHK